MLPMYAPPAVEMSWETETCLGDIEARRLAIEIEGLESRQGDAVVRCRDGDRVVVQRNQLFQRPGGHTSNVFMYETFEPEACELSVQGFLDEAPWLVACMERGRTHRGTCAEPIVPPPATTTEVHDFEARFEPHPLVQGRALYVSYRVRFGPDIRGLGAEVRTTLRCGGEAVAEESLLLVTDVRAGESWAMLHVLDAGGRGCSVDVDLGQHSLGSMDPDWTSLGTFRITGSR